MQAIRTSGTLNIEKLCHPMAWGWGVLGEIRLLQEVDFPHGLSIAASAVWGHGEFSQDPSVQRRDVN
jgi:hypothetical protein